MEEAKLRRALGALREAATRSLRELRDKDVEGQQERLHALRSKLAEQQGKAMSELEPTATTRDAEGNAASVSDEPARSMQDVATSTEDGGPLGLPESRTALEVLYTSVRDMLRDVSRAMREMRLTETDQGQDDFADELASNDGLVLDEDSFKVERTVMRMITAVASLKKDVVTGFEMSAREMRSLELRAAKLETQGRELQTEREALRREVEEKQRELRRQVAELDSTRARLESRHAEEEEARRAGGSGEEEARSTDELHSQLEIDAGESQRQGKGGIIRLREMLLLPSSSKLLPTGYRGEDLRSTLNIIRRISVDKALSDSLSSLSGFESFLPLPEFVYLWFGSNAPSQVSNARTRADGDCFKFLESLKRLLPEHPEVANFHFLLDACSADEVAYYMLARKTLLGVAVSPRTSLEVSKQLAVQACDWLIMRHADDAHAESVREEMKREVLEGAEQASETLEPFAFLGSLLMLYKEEKREVRRMLKLLFDAGKGLRHFSEMHKLRGMLQSIDPDITDDDVVLVYRQARALVEDEDNASLTFRSIWLVVERCGLLIRRQLIGLRCQPELLLLPRLRRKAPSVASIWLTVKPHVRSLIAKLCSSSFAVERQWGRMAEQQATFLEQLEGTEREGSLLIDSLRRLLATVLLWHSLQKEIHAHEAVATAEAELHNLAVLVMNRSRIDEPKCSFVYNLVGAAGDQDSHFPDISANLTPVKLAPRSRTSMY
eukprot:757032-Hanusia_phi.AAC.2